MKRSLLAGSVVAILGVAALSPAAFATPSPKPKQPGVPAHGVWKQTRATASFAASPKAPAVQQDITQHIHIDHLAAQLYAVAGVPGATERIYGKTRLEAGGQVLVTVTGSATAAAARSAGGRVIAQYGGASTVALAPAKLRALAATPGVDLVQPAHRAVVNADSEGVAKSGAATWHSSLVPGTTGTGMKIGIVDSGFANLDTEVTAGNLPAGLTVPASANHCATPVATQSQHGTAVAEIVHQMAPDAQLFLYCVEDNLGFAQAGDQAIGAGLDVVNSSLGFPGDGRGDGTGLNLPGWISSALTVKKARQAGVLWVQSSGNSAQDHWSGTLVDTSPHDGNVDLFGSRGDADGFLMHPNTVGTVALTWDRWSGAQLPVTLHIQEYDVNNNPVDSGHDVSTNPGAPNAPIRLIDVSNSSLTPNDDHLFVVSIRVANGTPALHYDLNYFGDVSPSFRAFPTAPYWCDTSTMTLAQCALDGSPARAAAGSVSEPASSPYALGVGAVYQGDNTLEAYSSRGSTIDGRVKPDILGFDGTTSNLPDFSAGFFGTSAAAPHVAGAAALVKAASILAGTPMDASETQAFLEARATPNANPATNAAGHGILALGAPSNVHSPAGSKYTALASPWRIVDTRIGRGAPQGVMTAHKEYTIDPAPAGVPADATSVVVNLTGTGATGDTYLALYPTTFAGTSNLNLSKVDPLAAVSATTPLNASGKFKLYNNAATVHAIIDVVGYFAPIGAHPTQSGFGALSTPIRILDTRGPTGGHPAPLHSGEELTIPIRSNTAALPTIPPDATSVIVNLTATGQSGAGYFAAYPTTRSGTSSLNYTKYDRANLAIVGLNPVDGSFKLFNYGSTAHAIVDVLGYFSPSALSSYVPLPSPVRIADSRYGNGGRLGPVPTAPDLVLDAAKLNGVPFSATGVMTGLTALGTANGYLSEYPTGSAVPATSSVNFTTGRTVPNAVAIAVGTASGSEGKISVHASRTTNMIVDLFGYFK